MKKILFILLAVVVALNVYAYERVITADNVEKNDPYKGNLPDFKDYWKDDKNTTKPNRRPSGKPEENSDENSNSSTKNPSTAKTGRSCYEGATCTTA